MENVFKYYEFSAFFKDASGVFNTNDICFSQLNDKHFLIFEKVTNSESISYNLFISEYISKAAVGTAKPTILETLVIGYDKSNPNHRIILKKYF